MSDIVTQTWHLPRERGGARGSVGAVVAAALTIAVLVAAAGAFVHDSRDDAKSAVVETPRPAPVPAWLDIIKPVQIYSLWAPEFAEAPLLYKARRLTFGAGREDSLAYGTLAGDRPSLRLRLYRGDGALLDSALAFQTSMHEGQPAGAKANATSPLATRFGRFEAADLALRDGPAKAVPCTAFGLGIDKPSLSITGVACGAKGKPLPREDLACLIERLDLTSAGEDRALAEFFARSELRRNSACAGMRLRPDGVHAAWLDDKPATGVKNLRRR